MTPEEKAVIQAAITWRRQLSQLFAAQGSSIPDLDLAHSVDELMASRVSEDEALKEWDPDYPGCAPEECGGSRLDPCSTVMRTKGARHDGDDWVNAGAVSCLACKGQGCEKCQNVGMWREADGPITLKPRGVVQPTWKPATFADLLPGDRARIGQEETTVTRVSRDQWHAKDRQWVDDNGKVRDHMTPWEREELRIDFTVNPGMRVYPPDVECEILCDAERAALLLLQRGFPGSTVVS